MFFKKKKKKLGAIKEKRSFRIQEMKDDSIVVGATMNNGIR